MARQDTSNCTRVTPECPVSETVYGDYFTFGACLFFIIAFSLLFFAQLGLGFRSRTWAFTFYLAVGTIFEVIGYIGRLMMSSNPYQEIAFILQILFLILAPTLVAAAISLTFKHIVLYYGRQFSFIKPVLYPWIFVGSDFISIVIQGIGGSVAASGTVGDKVDPVRADLGNTLLIAGVAFQVVNMVVCGAFMLVFLRRYRRAKASRTTTDAVITGTEKDIPASETRIIDHQDQPWRSTESDRKLKRYIYAISVAYIAIIIRCIYRVPEMAAGWGSDIMQDEASFLVLDGGMMLIAVFILTVYHPCFNFHFLNNKPPGFDQKTGRIKECASED